MSGKYSYKTLKIIPFVCHSGSCPKHLDAWNVHDFRGEGKLRTPLADNFQPKGCVQYRTRVYGLSHDTNVSQDEWDNTPMVAVVLPSPDPTGAQAEFRNGEKVGRDGICDGIGFSRDLIFESLMKQQSVPKPIRVAFLFLTRGYSFKKLHQGDLVIEPAQKAAIGHCLPYFKQDLLALNPDRVLLCGFEAGEIFFPGKFETAEYRRRRGLSIEVEGKSFPAQVTYNPHFASISPPIIKCIQDDCDKLWGRQFQFTGGTYKILRTLDEAMEYLDFLSEHEGFIAVDTETQNLNRKATNKLGMIQFATDDNLGVVLPFQHSQTPFDPYELEVLTLRLRDLFANPIKSQGWIAHNAKFEHTVFKNHLGTFMKSAPVYDTQAMAFLLDETRSERKVDIPSGGGLYSLKQLARDFLGWEGYDKGVLKFRGDGALLDLDLEVLAEYGCFTKGNRVLMAGGKVKDISEVKVGDRVVTHKNRIKKVTKTFVKKYKGPLYNIYCRDGYHIQGVTPNHPFLVQTEEGQKWIRADQLSIGTLCLKQRDNTVVSQCSAVRERVERAKQVVIDEVKNKVRGAAFKCFITPEKIEDAARCFDHPDFWWFLGLCLADGSVRHALRKGASKTQRRAVALVLSLHKKEISPVLKVVKRIFPDIHPSILKRKGSKGEEIVLSNRALAVLFDELLEAPYGGERACRIKHLPESLFYSLTKEQASEVLSGYFDGDGHFKKTSRGQFQTIANTVSINLANQIRLLLQKVDSHFTQTIIYAGSKYGKSKIKSTQYWTTIFGNSCFWWNSRLLKKKKIKNDFFKSYTPFAPVWHIEKEEAEVEVYNCEVEVDNSYICNGLKVHNSMDSYITYALFWRIQELAMEQDYLEPLMRLTKLFYSPATRLIAHMEMSGFKTDLRHVRNLAAKKGPFEKKLEKIEAEFKKLEPFIEANEMVSAERNAGNIRSVLDDVPWVLDMSKNANRELVFFKIMGLPPVSWSEKTGRPSIDEEFYSAYSEEYKEVRLFSEHEEIKKMKNTFVNKTLERIDPESGDADCRMDQRIRPDIHYSRLVTGRWAMVNPNMGQIPKPEEGEAGEEDIQVRKAVKDIFTVDKDCGLIQIDYKVNEVRWAGILAQDEALARIFNDAARLMQEAQESEDPELLKKAAFQEDVHRNTAAETFGVKLEDVTKEQRQASKAITFGILFQSSAKSIAESLNIPVEQAEGYIELFFSRMSGVAEWIKQMKQDASSKGYVEAPDGRRRRFWGFALPPSCPNRRSHCSRNERQAVNSPIQGCQDENDFVQTNRGLTKLKDLNPSVDTLLTYSGETNNYTVHDTGIKEVFSLETTLGSPRVTKDHRFFKYESEDIKVVRTSKLKVGDIICGSPYQAGNIERTETPEMVRVAELIGILLGDGSFGNERTITIAANTKYQYAEYIEGLIKSLYPCEIIRKKRKDRNVYQIAVHDVFFRKFLSRYGLFSTIKKYKQAPDWIFKENAGVRGAMLRGLYDTDGGISGSGASGKGSDTPTFTNTSEHLAYDFYALCKSLDIEASMFLYGKVWRVKILPDSVEKFFKIIKPFHGYKTLVKKRSRIKIVPKELCLDVAKLVLSSAAWAETYRTTKWSKQSRKKFSKGEQALLYRLRDGSGSSASCLYFLNRIEQSKARDNLIELCMLPWAKVRKITSLGYRRTRDIEIHTKDHSYCSHGLLMHNSASSGAMIGGVGSLLDYIEDNNKSWIIQNVVHDSAIIQVPKNEVIDLISIAEELFVNQAQKKMEEMGVKFNLPLGIDVEVGVHWGSLTKWKGTKTHAKELQDMVLKYWGDR